MKKLILFFIVIVFTNCSLLTSEDEQLDDFDQTTLIIERVISPYVTTLTNQINGERTDTENDCGVPTYRSYYDYEHEYPVDFNFSIDTLRFIFYPDDNKTPFKFSDNIQWPFGDDYCSIQLGCKNNDNMAYEERTDYPMYVNYIDVVNYSPKNKIQIRWPGPNIQSLLFYEPNFERRDVPITYYDSNVDFENIIRNSMIDRNCNPLDETAINEFFKKGSYNAKDFQYKLTRMNSESITKTDRFGNNNEAGPINEIVKGDYINDELRVYKVVALLKI